MIISKGIQNGLTNIEKGFNKAGCVPIVSLFSGTIRMLAGKVQVLAGLIMAGIGAINYAFNKDKKWEEYMNEGLELMTHGALNAIRGFGEAALCSATLVGNVALLIPNMAKDDEFSPYFAYGSFTQPEQARAFA